MLQEVALLGKDTTAAARHHEGALAVDVSGVSKTYRTRSGDVRAVDDVSFRIAPGEFASLLGPSGCGKSTLLNLISGLSEATSGSVLVGDEAVRRRTPNGTSVVFQRDCLLPWRTVLGNVLLPIDIAGLPRSKSVDTAREFLRLVGLAEFTGKWPHELSGGMRQRVALARSLITSPRLLLMDEPFGALDAMTREQMNRELLRMWDSTRPTVVFVTHSIAEAVFLSDRVILMSARPGRILREFDVDLPRPRADSVRAGPAFSALVQAIRQELENIGVL